MVKELMHDPIFLAGESEVATKEDLQVAKDLLDTLTAHVRAFPTCFFLRLTPQLTVVGK